MSHPGEVTLPALWPPGEPGAAPPEGGVHVWYVDLAAPPLDPAHTGALSPAERARAARFRIPAMRRRYVLGRALLREALGRAIGSDAARVPISEREDGKPRLSGNLALPFNLAHSGDLLLIAVSRAGEVGVDVERIRSLPAREALIRRVCTPAERETIDRADAAERLELFFRAWTRKEAVLKATGRGLRVRPAWIRVTLDDPVRGAWSYDGPGDPPPDAPGFLRGLIPVPGCEAALACGRGGLVRCRWWIR